MDQGILSENKSVFVQSEQPFSRQQVVDGILQIARFQHYMGAADKDTTDDMVKAMHPQIGIDSGEHLIERYGESLEPVINFFTAKENQSFIQAYIKAARQPVDSDDIRKRKVFTEFQDLLRKNGVSVVEQDSGRFPEDNKSMVKSFNELNALAEDLESSSVQSRKELGKELKKIHESFAGGQPPQWIILFSDDLVKGPLEEMIENLEHEYAFTWLISRAYGLKNREGADNMLKTIKFGEKAFGISQNRLVDQVLINLTSDVR